MAWKFDDGMARPLTLASLIGVYLVTAGCSKPVDPPAPIRPVIAQRVTAADGASSEAYSGAIHARFETPLSFQTAGKIVERHVSLGDTVHKGELLAQLDKADALSSAQVAKAAINVALTQRNLARRELNRFTKLHNKGMVGQAALDAKKSDYDVAVARLHEARTRYDLARNQLNYTSLYADHAGVITAVHAEVGQVISVGQPVFQMAHAGDRELFINVPEGRIDAIRHADKALVSLWALPGQRFIGKIREVAADADPATRTYLVKIALLNAGPQVKLGMTATALLKVTSDKSVVQLPLTSIYHDGDKPAVWVVNGTQNDVGLRDIAVGRYLNDAVEITAGLKQGEVVVTKGVHKLHAGERVKPLLNSKQPS